MAPVRYAVQYRKKTLLDPEKCLKDNCEAVIPIMRKVIEHESGEFDKAELLIISYSEKQGVWIAFDYDNPGHDECSVVGFRVGTKRNRITRLAVPAKDIHERIRASRGLFPTLVSLSNLHTELSCNN